MAQGEHGRGSSLGRGAILVLCIETQILNVRFPKARRAGLGQDRHFTNGRLWEGRFHEGIRDGGNGHFAAFAFL